MLSQFYKYTYILIFISGEFMIFTFFDPVNYDGKFTTDIFKNYKAYFNRIIKKYNIVSYNITGSPRPEMVAYELYGNPQLYWIILFLNDNYDPFNGWIKSQNACYDSADQRYSEIGGEQVLYHVTPSGEKFEGMVNYPDAPNIWFHKGDKNRLYPQYEGTLIPVDIYEDAIIDNEKYRSIRIVDPKDIDNLLNAFVREMEKSL